MLPTEGRIDPFRRNEISVSSSGHGDDMVWFCSLSGPYFSLSGCPRARKGGVKMTATKEEKEDPELK